MSGTVLRVAAWTLAVALVVAPVVAVVQGWVGAERWPLRTLRVNGELHQVDPARLRAVLLPFAQRGFFAVRLDDAQVAVSRLPWVDTAEVRKRWPDTLEVRVVEHRPIARWGEDRLLSDAGTLFPAAGAEAPASLPLLDGPDTRTAAVMELYGEARELFAPAGVDVRALRLDRFARLLPQLLAQGARNTTRGQPLLRADLRYTNGFALTWGDEPTPDESRQARGT